MSNDFSTIWQYRREIIEHLFAKCEGRFANLEGKLGMVRDELVMLVKLLMGNPKSYQIWEHRVWIINLGLELERQCIAAMAEAKKKAAAEIAAKIEDSKNDETSPANDNDEEPKLMNMPG